MGLVNFFNDFGLNLRNVQCYLKLPNYVSRIHKSVKDTCVKRFIKLHPGI